MEKSQKDITFIRKCVSDTLDGLRDGLAHFSGQCRTAVVYCISRGSDMFICDPQNLLHGHEPKLNKLYLEDQTWRDIEIKPDRKKYALIYPEKNLELAGLISYGGRSSSVYYQMWFTEHHPDVCSIGPIERWLEHSVLRLSHDIANESTLYTGISGTFLREYATHAVRDHIIDEMNIHLGWDSQIRVYPILDSILGISKTREEGVWPWGEVLFIEPAFIEDLLLLARFRRQEQPQLDNHKHVCKLLLAVSESGHKLVSDSKNIIGICGSSNLPEFTISADFRGWHGFLKVNQEKICSFSDGNFKSTTHKAKLVQFEELILEYDLDHSLGNTLFKTVASLVHHAENRRHGCTIVVDFNKNPVYISGQRLNPPLDLSQPHLMELAKSLLKVDGALHVGIDINLHGFALLLDGRAIRGEDRSRGARYNSALRFSAEHKNIIVIVVSADRPVSIIQEGVDINSQCQFKPVTSCTFLPEKLEKWVFSSLE